MEPRANSYPKKWRAIDDAMAMPDFALGVIGIIVVAVDRMVGTAVDGPVNDGIIMIFSCPDFI